MGATTGISWTSMTWNPWMGCHKVSQGCRACYMYQDKKRYGQDPTIVTRTSPTTFRAPFKWQKDIEQGKRASANRFVFTCSWSDFFIEEADPWREEVWDIMRATPRLIYQVLTKRPERIEQYLPKDWGQGWPHVWLGIRAESQAMFIARWNILKKIPAAIRFVSYEPALGPLDLHAGMLSTDCGDNCDHGPWPDQVLCGGESGPKARPCNLIWLRSLKNQCEARGIAVWMKQLGARPCIDTTGGTRFDDHTFYKVRDRAGADPSEWPDDLQVQQWPYGITP